MRLQNIEQLTPASKTQLLSSISNDICALLMCIGQHVEAGNLSQKNTEPLDEVIKMIRDTEVGYRRSLERGVRRLQRQKRWMRREYRGVVRGAETLGRMYRGRVQVLRERVGGMRAEMEMLRMRMEKKDKEKELEMEGKGKQMEEKMQIGREESSERNCGPVAQQDVEENDKEAQEEEADAEWEEESVKQD